MQRSNDNNDERTSRCRRSLYRDLNDKERERGRERSGKERKTNLVDGAPLWVPFVNFRFVIGVALERSGLPLLHSLRAKRGRRRGHSRRERGGHAECHFVACGAVFVCAGHIRGATPATSDQERSRGSKSSLWTLVAKSHFQI